MDIAITVFLGLMNGILQKMGGQVGLTPDQVKLYRAAIKELYDLGENLFDEISAGASKYDAWTKEDFEKYLTPPTYDQL